MCISGKQLGSYQSKLFGLSTANTYRTWRQHTLSTKPSRVKLSAQSGQQICQRQKQTLRQNRFNCRLQRTSLGVCFCHWLKSSTACSHRPVFLGWWSHPFSIYFRPTNSQFTNCWKKNCVITIFFFFFFAFFPFKNSAYTF